MLKLLFLSLLIITIHNAASAQINVTFKRQTLSKDYELVSYLTTNEKGCGAVWSIETPGRFQWSTCGRSTIHEFIIPEGCTPITRETTKNGSKSGYVAEQKGNLLIITLFVSSRPIFGPNKWIGVAVSCQK